jgi:methylenetetrahydrofolate--tRNA-(uracil-5-)-methyltransferase
MGLVVAWMLAGEITGRRVAPPPPTTMLGGLYHHVTAARDPGYKYGPTNVNYGLLPPLDGTRKDNKKPRMSERARADLGGWLAELGRPIAA